MIRLMFESELVRMANRRCWVIALFHGVGGAGDVGRATRGSLVSDAGLAAVRARVAAEPTPGSPTALATSRTMRIWTRNKRAGLRTMLSMARRISSRFDGIGSGVHDSGTMVSSPFGVGEVTISSMIWPDAPSIVAWWYFVSSAQRSWPSPSMTYTSHSGRLRSIGRPWIRATCSASWSA